MERAMRPRAHPKLAPWDSVASAKERTENGSQDGSPQFHVSPTPSDVQVIRRPIVTAGWGPALALASCCKPHDRNFTWPQRLQASSSRAGYVYFFMPVSAPWAWMK